MIDEIPQLGKECPGGKKAEEQAQQSGEESDGIQVMFGIETRRGGLIGLHRGLRKAIRRRDEMRGWF
jgi:hypothetical protein